MDRFVFVVDFADGSMKRKRQRQEFQRQFSKKSFQMLLEEAVRYCTHPFKYCLIKYNLIY